MEALPYPSKAMVSEFPLGEASAIPSKGGVTNPLAHCNTKELRAAENPGWSEMLLLKWQDPSPLKQEPFDACKQNTESQRKSCQCQLIGKLLGADTLGRCFDFSQNLFFFFTVTQSRGRRKVGPVLLGTCSTNPQYCAEFGHRNVTTPWRVTPKQYSSIVSCPSWFLSKELGVSQGHLLPPCTSLHWNQQEFL